MEKVKFCSQCGTRLEMHATGKKSCPLCDKNQTTCKLSELLNDISSSITGNFNENSSNSLSIENSDNSLSTQDYNASLSAENNNDTLCMEKISDSFSLVGCVDDNSMISEKDDLTKSKELIGLIDDSYYNMMMQEYSKSIEQNIEDKYINIDKSMSSSLVDKSQLALSEIDIFNKKASIYKARLQKQSKTFNDFVVIINKNKEFRSIKEKKKAVADVMRSTKTSVLKINISFLLSLLGAAILIYFVVAGMIDWSMPLAKYLVGMSIVFGVLGAIIISKLRNGKIYISNKNIKEKIYKYKTSVGEEEKNIAFAIAQRASKRVKIITTSILIFVLSWITIGTIAAILVM